MQSQTIITIILFAKPPIAGHVKTRLIPALGKTGAVNIHKKLLHLCLDNASQVPNINLQLHYSEKNPFFIYLAKKYKLSLRPQCKGTLGQKMQYAIINTSGPVLLMGSDCPSITPAILRQCISAIKKYQWVFLPAEDGGYGLVGVNDTKNIAISKAFDNIPWGTESVMSCTRKRLQESSWTWVEPSLIWDVDRPEDLPRLSTLN